VFETLILALIGLVFPKAPSWLSWVISTLPGLVMSLVKGAEDRSLDGDEKFQLVRDDVAEWLDDALDGVPRWSGYPEEGRDRIIDGLVELANFVKFAIGSAGKTKTLKALRKATRKLKRRVRVEAKRDAKEN